MYAACQHSDDRKHAAWNDGILKVLAKEQADFRAKGYRTMIVGDLNGHIGSAPGVGIEGNHQSIYPNGQRILDFLERTNMKHINGATRWKDGRQEGICKGLWTWQWGSSKTVID